MPNDDVKALPCPRTVTLSGNRRAHLTEEGWTVSNFTGDGRLSGVSYLPNGTLPDNLTASDHRAIADILDPAAPPAEAVAPPKPDAWLFQHGETGRTTIAEDAEHRGVMQRAVNWHEVGPLYLSLVPPTPEKP